MVYMKHPGVARTYRECKRKVKVRPGIAIVVEGRKIASVEADPAGHVEPTRQERRMFDLPLLSLFRASL